MCHHRLGTLWGGRAKLRDNGNASLLSQCTGEPCPRMGGKGRGGTPRHCVRIPPRSKTAKSPGSFARPGALLRPERRRASLQRTLLLLHCSYEPMRQTKSLPPSLASALTMGLCRLLPVPAGRWPFPTLSPQSVYRRLDPYPAAPLRCFSRFFPKGFGLASDVTSSARQNITSQCNFNDAALLGAAVIPLCSGSHTCSTPRLHPPLRIHLAGRPGLLRHAMPIWLPNMSRGIATCLNRAIGTAGLPPAGLRPCRLLPTSGSIQTSSTRD